MRRLLFAVVSCLVADLASAGMSSACPEPSDVPSSVEFTIGVEAGFDFGNVDENTCQKIVKRGVGLCKAQVKGAAKCWRKDISTVRSIAVKQCNQIADASEREGCRAFFKDQQQEIEADVEDDKDVGLDLCEGGFASDLAEDCALGLPL